MIAKMVRTQEEIVARYRAVASGDLFGFETGEYLPYLDFAHAKEFLKPEATQENWEGGDDPYPTCASPVDKMREYMTFAFDKAHGERGISANRSVQHCIAWIWLTGDEEFHSEIQEMYDRDYHDYGKPILRRICERYGWNPKEHGDF